MRGLIDRGAIEAGDNLDFEDVTPEDVQLKVLG